MGDEHKVSAEQRSHSPWPRYDAAALGFRNYWYPVTFSHRIGRKPLSVQLLGEPVMFLRERGRVYAFHDACPHRGIPLSLGRQEFAATWTCRYHGWTFDLATGELKAALTDGPDSPICGKVRARTYPVEERAGLVWVYMGEGKPPAVEEDIPEEFLHSDSVIVGRVTVRRGNWRYAAENGFDEAHGKYLHRYGSLWTMFSHIPAWSKKSGGPVLDKEGTWLSRPPDDVALQATYPGLGTWPRRKWWKRPRRRTGKGPGVSLGIRLPGILRTRAGLPSHFEWYVPVDRDHHRYLQFLVTRDRGWGTLKFRLQYWLYTRWLFHVQFNNQDGWMVALMPETPPDRLFRPDVSITSWRRLCENGRREVAVEPAGHPVFSRQNGKEADECESVARQ